MSAADQCQGAHGGGGSHSSEFRRVLTALLVPALILASAQAGWADRTQLKPGWNVFSPAQDVEMGKQASQQAEKQLWMLNDRRVDDYVNRLGQKLAARAPGYKYTFQYKVVNDSAINAFALPGGFIYVNRGAIELADTEAQLAGVLAHETSHVVLRHGTAQATKASAWQVPLGILGAVVGGNSVAGLLTQLGAGFTMNSILLKNSRSDETQADVMGTQILYDTNYDPRAMSQFFEKIQAESKGHETAQFFSDHPNPGNRSQRVNEEVDKLGGPPPGYQSDSAEFRSIKVYLLTLPPPPKAPKVVPGTTPAGRPAPPASTTLTYRTDDLELRYPGNWKPSGQGSALSLFPEGGVVTDARKQQSLAYGVMANLAGLRDDNVALQDATDQLIQGMRQSNPNLRVERQRESTRVDGRPAISTYLSNDSPLGGRETDWLVTTTMRPDGLLYMICVAPDADYASYERAFQDVVGSVRFR
jgi:Zn-dependent protease with chaperone function